MPGRLKLVRRQAEVAERRPERLACIGSVQELLSHLYWEPRLRPARKRAGAASFCASRHWLDSNVFAGLSDQGNAAETLSD